MAIATFGQAEASAAARNELAHWRKILLDDPARQAPDEATLGQACLLYTSGYIKAKAVVTKRIKPMKCDGKTVHIVGIPIHWGFMGAAKKGFATNTLTPFVGDANIETPEFKAFLVDVRPDVGPVA